MHIKISRGKTVIISDEDFEWASKLKWYACPYKNTYVSGIQDWYDLPKKDRDFILKHR